LSWVALDQHGPFLPHIVACAASSQANSLARPEFRQNGRTGALEPIRITRVIGARLSCVEEFDMRGMLLWLIGIPIPIIILLYLFGAM
jgi:hypothetical protein